MISSSRIRESMAQGHVEEAIAVPGTPAPGPGNRDPRRRGGRGWAFPRSISTASIRSFPSTAFTPRKRFIRGEDGSLSRGWAAACNIGPNPTFGEQIRKVEAHLLDFDGDLYGRVVELDFLARLRSTRAFSGIDDLLAQIGRTSSGRGRFLEPSTKVLCQR